MTEDEKLGAYVYCTQHCRVHDTGWCTVSVGDKIALKATTYEEAKEEAANNPECQPYGGAFDLKRYK